MLRVAHTNAENMESHHPYTVDDRSWEEMEHDADYQKAKEIILNLLQRELEKNDLRILGSDALSLDELERLELEE
jgi:hypothetical protein